MDQTKTKTFNKKIAVAPFQVNAVEVTGTGTGAVKVAVIKNKVTLTALQVLFPSSNPDIPQGSFVWVRSDLYTLPWAKEKYTVGGVEFILMPENYVELVTASND